MGKHLATYHLSTTSSQSQKKLPALQSYDSQFSTQRRGYQPIPTQGDLEERVGPDPVPSIQGDSLLSQPDTGLHVLPFLESINKNENKDFAGKY